MKFQGKSVLLKSRSFMRAEVRTERHDEDTGRFLELLFGSA